jgi:2-dehydropantoate 2-reductase
MRFIIHGAGAIGSVIGGKLAEAGQEVVLITREAHAQAITKNGLTLKSRAGDRRILNLTAVTSPSKIAPRSGDLVFITVKSARTADSVHHIREVFPEATPVFCLQNGVRNEEEAAHRFLHVYGAMAGISATLLAPGVVSHTRETLLSLGNYPLGCDALAYQIAEKLTAAGFTVTTHDSIMPVKWSKLILNLNNATFAIIDKHLQLGLVTPAISRFMADVMEEGLHTLNVAGISLDDANNPYQLRELITQLRNTQEDTQKIQQEENSPIEHRTYPSTWSDLKQNRGETEASYFNGEIILLGEKYGAPTPINATLFAIVEKMAAEGAHPGLYTLDELLDLVEHKRLKLYDGEGIS